MQTQQADGGEENKPAGKEEEKKAAGAMEDMPVPGDPEGAQKTFVELAAGIFAYGILLQAAGVWFFEDKAGAGIAFWIGIFTAFCMAWHMYRTLERALLDERRAQKTLALHSMIRYAVVIAVLVIVQYRQAGSPVVTFFGIMGLKAGAYLQPFVHKAMMYLKKQQ